MFCLIYFWKWMLSDSSSTWEVVVDFNSEVRSFSMALAYQSFLYGRRERRGQIKSWQKASVGTNSDKYLKRNFDGINFLIFQCSRNLDATKIPKNKVPLETKYEDSTIEDKEDELKEFLTWPIGDVVVATIDTILQVCLFFQPFHNMDNIKWERQGTLAGIPSSFRW